MDISKYAKRLTGQPMFLLLDKIKKMEQAGHDIIHFEIGDSDFKTPPKIVKACIDSLKNGDTHYTSSAGILELREAICRYTSRQLGFKPSVEQVVVAPGANPLIYCLFQCLVNQGETVLIPDPGFPTYESVANLLDLSLSRYKLSEQSNFSVHASDVENNLYAGTRIVIVNSPSNPTGGIIDEKTMRFIYESAANYNAYLLSDEMYSLMTYEHGLMSPAIINDDHCKKRVIILNGFSKCYAMTGWRIGYIIAPEEVAKKVNLMLQTIVSCTNSFVQKAAITALDEEHKEIPAMMKDLRRRRDLLVKGLNRLPGITCRAPDGAFYVFANIKETKMSSQKFCDFILEKAGVAALPGNHFGIYGAGFVRFCFANGEDKISQALARMADVL